ncbi:MAG: carbonate dehydratase [Flavobacteriales bacterium]|jgi:carbonic anhydrase|nr:carbonate dehydratase [Flavobacteriales bacterium]HQV74565.1 carbonate dehydratase [Flavobacteriales bacterium]HQW39905.1 carbonate dehydratase [Flavobacteriales bacterium]
MGSYNRLLKNNIAWAANTVARDPEFFTRLSEIQSPEFLWIGCSDSRVPANEITGTDPGEIFVHRNIANMVVHTDLNLLSVLQYAVEMLHVKHIIVCGHYGCGGVKAAMSNDSLGIINKWLRNIKDVRRLHRDELDALPDENKRFDRLVELNVTEQVMDLSKTSIVQRAWKERGGPDLHGWVYSLADGIIHPTCEIKAGAEIDPIYRFDGL